MYKMSLNYDSYRLILWLKKISRDFFEKKISAKVRSKEIENNSMSEAGNASLTGAMTADLDDGFQMARSGGSSRQTPAKSSSNGSSGDQLSGSGYGNGGKGELWKIIILNMRY
jgi:hypothetical protein